MFREFKSLSGYFVRYRTPYILGFTVLVIVDGAQMLIPQWIKRAVNIIVTADYHLREVLFCSLAMIATMAVIAAGRFLWRYFIYSASRRIEAELRDRLFSRLLDLDYTFYLKNKTGDLMARATNDLGAVRMAIGFGLVALVDGTAMALCILVIIFIQDWQTALYAVLPLPLITGFILVFGAAVGKRFGRVQSGYSTMSEVAEETFAGINVVKSFVKENWFVKKFAEANDAYKAANMSLAKLFGALFPAVSFLAGITALIVLYAGGRRVIQGAISPGSLVALLAYFQMLIWPVLGAGFTVNLLQRGAVSLGRINAVLTTEPLIISGNAPAPTPPARGRIEFRGLSFSFPRLEGAADAAADTAKVPAAGETRPSFSFKDVSFTVEAGEWLGVMGKTGSGKTTLVKFLPRLVDPPPGTVFVDGVDVCDWDLTALRGRFGMALQDSYLFSDSVAGNIAYYARCAAEGTPPSSVPPLAQVIELAALGRDLEILRDGADTLIGERGLTLSGGQKQRAAIARAALCDPEILVLDDSLSAVDTETEKRILDGLYKYRRGKTTVIVSHRAGAFRNVDKIAAFEDGRLIEFGTKSALTAQNGYYARIARF